MSTIRKESSAAAKFFADLGRHKKRKKKEKKTSTGTKSIITSTEPVAESTAKSKATEVYQPHTLNQKGKPTRDLTYKYDRSIFGDYRDDNYVDLRKTLKLQQTPKPNTTTETTVLGSTSITKVTTSGEKKFPISVTSGEEIKGRSEIDHRWPLSSIARGITPVSQFAPEFVKKKWKVREGGTRQLSSKQLSDIHADPKNTQLLSRAENQAKGSKVLSDYTKIGGWGTETEPQTKGAVYQAESYHDALVDAAKKFGKRGLMSREDAQAYREITGKEPHKLLDADNPEYSPPSTKQNITGFDKPGEIRRQSAADRHFGKEKAREAKEYRDAKAWAEYGGERPTDTDRLGYISKWGGEIIKSKKELDLEKEHGKQNRLRSMGKHQSKPKSVITGTFPSRPSGKEEGKKKGYELSPKKQWRRIIGTKEWEKVPKKAKVKAKTVKKDTSSKVTTVTKKSYLDKMFPGINAPKLVKNKKGILVTKRIRDMVRKTKEQRFSDSESWM